MEHSKGFSMGSKSAKRMGIAQVDSSMAMESQREEGARGAIHSAAASRPRCLRFFCFLDTLPPPPQLVKDQVASLTSS